MNDAVVVDTNVASFALRRDARLRPCQSVYRRRRMVLPFQVVAELRFGALRAGWGQRRRAGLERYISRGMVVPYTDELAVAWARVTLHAERIGRRLEAGDAWIAATAVHLDLPLLTHDADFRALDYPGLTVVCHAP